MAPTLPFLTFFLLGFAAALTPGKTSELHPKLDTWKCSHKGGCTKQNTAIVLDELSHPVHQLTDSKLDCGSGNTIPNATVCPDEATCAKNCIVEGISDYTNYGVHTANGTLELHQLMPDGSVPSPRVYLLEENEQKYEMLKLTGQELAFDVDLSKLPCGMNGALYLSEMEQNGGKSALNTAGPAYGSGYCDAQCFVTPFINGVGNIEGSGSCCNEMDIWEANKMATSIAPHTCNQTSLYKCTGAQCGFNGTCDQWGCSYNPYGLGNHDYYGPGLKVDTNRRFTVVTQFPAENGTLKAINRLYIQDGKIVQNAAIGFTGKAVNASITNEFCNGRGGHFMDLGGVGGMGDALSRGMVLVFSVWWAGSGAMNWLDSGSAGPCNATEGDPSIIKAVEKDPAVTFSMIKWGEIGSTYDAK